MRSRLSLYLNSLSLEEILYLEEEIERRKEKYRRDYAVLSVQTDRRVLSYDAPMNLGKLAREMRKFVGDCAAQGGGIQLAYSPEVSVLMFTTVEGAAKTATALITGLAEFNGRIEAGSYHVGLKLGLAAGEDTLAPGSPRCVRTSPLVKRANQAAWRSSPGALMMDEHAHESWPNHHKPVRVPIEIDGCQIYRVVPSQMQTTEDYDNERLNEFLKQVQAAGIATLKYALERHEEVPEQTAGAWSKPVAIAELHLEGFDANKKENLTYSERLSASGYSDRLEDVRRVLGDMGLALVRLDAATNA